MAKAMRVPHPETRDRLYDMVAGEFARALSVAQRLREPKRGEFLRELVKTAYQTGLDRGYDMAADIFNPEGA